MSPNTTTNDSHCYNVMDNVMILVMAKWRSAHLVIQLEILYGNLFL